MKEWKLDLENSKRERNQTGSLIVRRSGILKNKMGNLILDKTRYGFKHWLWYLNKTKVNSVKLMLFKYVMSFETLISGK